MRFLSPVVLVGSAILLPLLLPAQQTITGQGAFGDWSQQQPGVLRKITLADLPQPNPAEAVNNTPHVIPRPADAWPLAPAGFKVTLYAGGDSAPIVKRLAKSGCGGPRSQHPGDSCNTNRFV